MFVQQTVGLDAVLFQNFGQLFCRRIVIGDGGINKVRVRQRGRAGGEKGKGEQQRQAVPGKYF